MDNSPPIFIHRSSDYYTRKLRIVLSVICLKDGVQHTAGTQRRQAPHQAAVAVQAPLLLHVHRLLLRVVPLGRRALIVAALGRALLVVAALLAAAKHPPVLLLVVHVGLLWLLLVPLGWGSCGSLVVHCLCLMTEEVFGPHQCLCVVHKSQRARGLEIAPCHLTKSKCGDST